LTRFAIHPIRRQAACSPTEHGVRVAIGPRGRHNRRPLEQCVRLGTTVSLPGTHRWQNGSQRPSLPKVTSIGLGATPNNRNDFQPGQETLIVTLPTASNSTIAGRGIPMDSLEGAGHGSTEEQIVRLRKDPRAFRGQAVWRAVRGRAGSVRRFTNHSKRPCGLAP
jgi:hypothetical protein